MWMSNKFLSDADAAGPQAMLWESLLRLEVGGSNRNGQMIPGVFLYLRFLAGVFQHHSAALWWEQQPATKQTSFPVDTASHQRHNQLLSDGQETIQKPRGLLTSPQRPPHHPSFVLYIYSGQPWERMQDVWQFRECGVLEERQAFLRFSPCVLPLSPTLELGTLKSSPNHIVTINKHLRFPYCPWTGQSSVPSDPVLIHSFTNADMLLICMPSVSGRKARTSTKRTGFSVLGVPPLTGDR